MYYANCSCFWQAQYWNNQWMKVQMFVILHFQESMVAEQFSKTEVVFSSPQFIVTTAMSKSALLLQWCFAVVCCDCYCLMLLFFVPTASFFPICAMLYQGTSIRSRSKILLWIQLLFYCIWIIVFFNSHASPLNITAKFSNSMMTYVPFFSTSWLHKISSFSTKCSLYNQNIMFFLQNNLAFRLFLLKSQVLAAVKSASLGNSIIGQ